MLKEDAALPINEPTDLHLKHYVPFNVVQKKVLAYYDFMKKHESILGKESQYMQFYIDKNSFERMIQISQKEGFDSFAAFYGLGDGGNPNQITVCFVGVDEDKNILASLKPNQDSVSTDQTNNLNKTGDSNSLTGADDDWQPPIKTGKSIVDGKSVLIRMDAESIKSNTNIFTLDSDRKDIETFFNL